MSTELMQINTKWLIWARESAYFKKETVARKMKVKVETIDDWERTGLMRYEDIKKISKIYHVGPARFFIPTDPIYEKPIADFRTIKNKKAELTPPIVFELRNARSRRKTLLNIEENDAEFIIPDFKLKDYDVNTVDEAIEIINNVIRLNSARRKEFTIDDWIAQVEKLGILVFQFYSISPKDLRGYAIFMINCL